jgi:hypothetical protein
MLHYDIMGWIGRPIAAGLLIFGGITFLAQFYRLVFAKKQSFTIDD